MNYADDLDVLKRSFVGGGEGGFYLKALQKLRGRSHLDWLDIGIGRDGTSLRPFVNQCRSSGQSLSITGIDPDATADVWVEDGARWTLIRGDFQSWVPDGQFDVINADQSLYYLRSRVGGAAGSRHVEAGRIVHRDLLVARGRLAPNSRAPVSRRTQRPGG